MTNCDMCGTLIQDGECSCGTWREPGENPTDTVLRSAMDCFHDMKQFVLTGDAPHLGCAFVFFRGDYNDAQKVKAFIYEMKGRPYCKT